MDPRQRPDSLILTVQHCEEDHEANVSQITDDGVSSVQSQRSSSTSLWQQATSILLGRSPSSNVIREEEDDDEEDIFLEAHSNLDEKKDILNFLDDDPKSMTRARRLALSLYVQYRVSSEILVLRYRWCIFAFPCDTGLPFPPLFSHNFH